MLPFRQIHLDFHTGPAITDVGVDFDAGRFASVMKASHVNSVTVFAKCHHGHLYYNTNRPERHPGLSRDLNLLAEQVRALHGVGIRAPIYISVQCDEYAANEHPEWVARKADGTPVGAGPFAPGWQILDMSSPYQDYLVEQTAEVLRLFDPVDGIFFDMCWDQTSCSNYAVEGMVARKLDPLDESHRATYAHAVAMEYMQRLFTQVKAAAPDAGVYFNSRPLGNLAEEVPFLTQVEIEALPTGGWGYLYFPKNVRFARTLSKSYLGMTARFHKGWADFGGLKPYAALEYETSQMMAHGAGCSIGDQMHPRGTLDVAAYELIARAYKRVADREPWLTGAAAVADIGVLRAPTHYPSATIGSEEGATRLLMQLKHQFDIIDADADFSRYTLLILPDSLALTPELIKRLETFVSVGGKLLATGTSGLSADGKTLLLPSLGIKAEGMSDFSTTYIRFHPDIATDVPATDHVIYERGVRVRRTGGHAVATVVHPYFERTWDHFCSHFQTPGDQPSPYDAAVTTPSTAYVAYPIFSAYHKHGNYPYRLLVRNLIERLLPEPLLRVDGPLSLEATVMHQNGRVVVHLLHYTPERRTADLDIVEDIVPLHEIKLSLKIDQRPARLYQSPDRQPIEFAYDAGRVRATLSVLHGHAMIVVEPA